MYECNYQRIQIYKTWSNTHKSKFTSCCPNLCTLPTRSIYHSQIIAENTIDIFSEKFKIIKFSGKDPVLCKICIRVLERVNKFDFLSSRLSYLEELDVSNKILKFNKAINVD